MQKLIVTLCVSLAAGAPWPFSMWRQSQKAFGQTSPDLPKFYHTTPQLADQVSQLASKCEGLSVEMVKDGLREIQVAKYKAPGSQSAKFKTMVVAGEHARELIGSEIALNFLKALCGHAPAADIEESKKDTEFLVMINANPGSRAAVENGEFCRRVNPNRVDINRNFDVDWSSVDHNDKDTNPGRHAFDQAESRILKQQMEAFKPHAYLDLHSGFRGMFFPNAVAADKLLATKLQRLAAQIDEDTCQCPLGVANEEVGYHTAGSALDYSYSVLKVPFSMAMEVYVNEASEEVVQLEARWSNQKGDLLKPLATGSSFMENGISPKTIIPMSLIQSGDAKMSPSDPDFCLNYFNPTTQESYDKTLSKWTNALARLSIKSRELPTSATTEANFGTANAVATTMSLKSKMPKESYLQAPQNESPPVWFAVKTLGLLFVIYLAWVAFKYYKAKQSKSAESAPITAQMAPVQVSD